MLRKMLNIVDKGIEFDPLDLDSLVLAVFVDAGFEETPDSSSWLGLITTLMENTATPT